MSSKNNFIRNVILEVIETSLEAQLRSVRRLKTGEKEKSSSVDKGKSQIDLAYDILLKAGAPLHINEIIQQIQKIHHVQIDRESLVSALTKKVKRGVRFIRTDKNTFAAKGHQ